MGSWWQIDLPYEATSVQGYCLDISECHVHGQFFDIIPSSLLETRYSDKNKANSKSNAFPRGRVHTTQMDVKRNTLNANQIYQLYIWTLQSGNVQKTRQSTNLNRIWISKSWGNAKPPELTVAWSANAANSQTQTEDMAAKINVNVPFKISHKASPCRGGHC